MGSKNLHFKVFVREARGADRTPEKVPPLPSTNLNGEEAQQFYQNVISSSPTSHQSGPLKALKGMSCKKQKQRVPTMRAASIFTAAQNNEIDGLRTLVELGVDVNCKDEFGWTPLMCAACNGSESAVRYLLGVGADLSVADKGGLTAIALAQKKKHQGVLNLLLSKNSPLSSKKKTVDEGRENDCDLCKVKYRGDTKTHETSTVHLFRLNTRSRTFYGIPESNKGFQLLMQQGWNREQGLGPDGRGRRFPIQVRKKTNRSGIGALELKKEKAVAGLQRSQHNSTQAQDSRRAERLFRMEFS